MKVSGARTSFRIPWTSLSTAAIVQDAEGILRYELEHCHRFVQSVAAILLFRMFLDSATARPDWNDLLKFARSLLQPLPKAGTSAQQIAWLQKSFGLKAARSAQGSKAAQLKPPTVDARSMIRLLPLLSLIPVLSPSHWLFVAGKALENFPLEALTKDLFGALPHISADAERTYFAAGEY